VNELFNNVKKDFKNWKVDLSSPDLNKIYLEQFLRVTEKSNWDDFPRNTQKRIISDFAIYIDARHDVLFRDRLILDDFFKDYLGTLLRFYTRLFGYLEQKNEDILSYCFAILFRISLLLKNEKYFKKVSPIIKLAFGKVYDLKLEYGNHFLFSFLSLNPKDKYLDDMFMFRENEIDRYFDFKMILGSSIVIRSIFEFRNLLKSNAEIQELRKSLERIYKVHNKLFVIMKSKHVKSSLYDVIVNKKYPDNQVVNDYEVGKYIKLCNLAFKKYEITYCARNSYISSNVKDVKEVNYVIRKEYWDYLNNLNFQLDGIALFLRNSLEKEDKQLNRFKKKLKDNINNITEILKMSDEDKRFLMQLNRVSVNRTSLKYLTDWTNRMDAWGVEKRYKNVINHHQVAWDDTKKTISELVSFLSDEMYGKRANAIETEVELKLDELALDYLTFQIEFMLDKNASKGLIRIISAQEILKIDRGKSKQLTLKKEHKELIKRMISGKNDIVNYPNSDKIDVHQKISDLDSYTNILSENSQIINDSGRGVKEVINALKVSLKHLRILRKESVYLFPKIMAWPIIEALERKIGQMDHVVDRMVAIFETENEAEAKKELNSIQIAPRMRRNIVEWMKNRFMYEELLDLTISKSTSEDRTTKFLKFIMNGGSLLLIFFPYFLVTVFNAIFGEQSALPSKNIIYSYLPFIVGILVNVCIVLYYHISRVKILESVTRNQILTPNILGAIFIAGFQLFVTDEAWGQGFLAHPIIQLVLVIGLVTMSYYLVRNNIIGDQEPIKADAKSTLKKNTTVLLSKKDDQAKEKFKNVFSNLRGWNIVSFLASKKGDQAKDKSKNMILNRRAWNIVSLGLWQTYVFVALFSMMTSAVMGGESRVDFYDSAQYIPQFDYGVGKWAPSTWIYLDNVFGADLDIHILPYAILVWSVEVYFLGAILQTLLQRKNN